MRKVEHAVVRDRGCLLRHQAPPAPFRDGLAAAKGARGDGADHDGPHLLLERATGLEDALPAAV
eukprot:1605765-Alexandrium_andersonii.AAC.1